MKKIRLFYILLLLPSLVLTQGLTGVWQGYIARSNPECPLYPQVFLTTLLIEQSGNDIATDSEIILEGTPYFAFYTGEGSFTDNTLIYIAEPTQGVPPPGSNWCTSVVVEAEYFEEEDLLIATSSSINGSKCCESTSYLRRLTFLSDTILCKGELVELEARGENVKWYADNNLDTLLGSGNTIEVLINEPTSFYLTQTFLGEESPAVRFEVDVYESQITDFEIVTTNACNDNTGMVEVLLENGIDALFRIDGGDYSSRNMFEGLIAGGYELTIQDENGCEIDTTFQIIDQDCSIKIPNAFTPDGDGLNDYFRLLVQNEFNGNINLFRVFNRWGQNIIDLQNVTIEDAIWDGRQNEKLLPPDVYVYLIEVRYLSGKTELFSGDITLIR